MVAGASKLLRVPVSGLRTGQLKLDRDTAHYLINVHRAVAGTQFLAFDVEAATEAIATLVKADTRQSVCTVDPLEVSCRVPRHRLVLIQAFGKGAKVDEVVRDATALDATEIWVVSTSRSALSGPQDIRGRLGRWRKIAVQAARQSERGNIPAILGVLGFQEALDSLEEFTGQRWLLSPRANDALGDKMTGSQSGGAALLVGPEGGFDDKELAQARVAGFAEVRLGFRVLRSETAVTAVLGALAALRDRVDSI
jgi:16S rRNA (uracil1498-N3)-methyltransferase